MKSKTKLNPLRLFSRRKRSTTTNTDQQQAQPPPTNPTNAKSVPNINKKEERKTLETQTTTQPKTAALFNALHSEQYSVFQQLLNEGANINAQDANGDTALHIAIRSAHSGAYEAVLDLIKRRCDVNIKNNQGETPFQLALERRYYIIKKLLECGAEDVTSTNTDGETALHVLCDYSVETIRRFLERGVDVNAQDGRGNTVLHLVARRRRDAVNVVELLMEYGARAGVVNVEGRNALHEAAGSNSVKLVGLLREKGYSVGEKDYWGNTALHLAAAGRADDVVQYLLELEEVQMQARNEDGMMALEKALSGNTRVRRAGRDCHPNSQNSISVHVGIKDTVLLRLLLKAGVDINAKDRDGRTALHAAILENDKKSLQILLDHGADVNIENRNGHTPAKLAAMRGKYDLVSVLVKAGSRRPPRVLKVYDPSIFEDLMEWEVLRWD